MHAVANKKKVSFCVMEELIVVLLATMNNALGKPASANKKITANKLFTKNPPFIALGFQTIAA